MSGWGVTASGVSTPTLPRIVAEPAQGSSQGARVASRGITTARITICHARVFEGVNSFKSADIRALYF